MQEYDRMLLVFALVNTYRSLCPLITLCGRKIKKLSLRDLLK